MTSKQNVIHHVCDTAMHILHDSYLANTNLWPKKGFKAGWGIGYGEADIIYYAARTIQEEPNKGILVFNLHARGRARRINQMIHLKIIFDYTITTELYFEDAYPKSTYTFNDDQVVVDFTYTQKNNNERTL